MRCSTHARPVGGSSEAAVVQLGALGSSELEGAHQDAKEQSSELQNYTSYGSSSTSRALLCLLVWGGGVAKSDRLTLTVKGFLEPALTPFEDIARS